MQESTDNHEYHEHTEHTEHTEHREPIDFSKSVAKINNHCRLKHREITLSNGLKKKVKLSCIITPEASAHLISKCNTCCITPENAHTIKLAHTRNNKLKAIRINPHSARGEQSKTLNSTQLSNLESAISNTSISHANLIDAFTKINNVMAGTNDQNIQTILDNLKDAQNTIALAKTNLEQAYNGYAAEITTTTKPPTTRAITTAKPTTTRATTTTRPTTTRATTTARPTTTRATTTKATTTAKPTTTLGPIYDLMKNPWCPVVYDQGQLGSCTANGALFMFKNLYNMHNWNPDTKTIANQWEPSRYQFYYAERDDLTKRTGTNYVYNDSGSDLSGAVNTFLNGYLLPESAWPYAAQFNSYNTRGVNSSFVPDELYCEQYVNNIDYYVGRFSYIPVDPVPTTRITSAPTRSNYDTYIQQNGVKIDVEVTYLGTGTSTVDGYGQKTTVSLLTQALADGYVITCSFNVYSSFYNVSTANPIYTPSGSLEGGHCVAIVGYNSNTKLFKCINSWGPLWADKGCFYVHEKYMINSGILSSYAFQDWFYIH